MLTGMLLHINLLTGRKLFNRKKISVSCKCRPRQEGEAMDKYWGISKEQLYLYNIGKDYNCYRFLGAHLCTFDGTDGVRFCIWAPDVKSVRVTGDFCGWSIDEHFLVPLDNTGVWCGFIPGVKEGDTYKYVIEPEAGEFHYKADPVGFWAQVRPGTASKVAQIFNYEWNDEKWMKKRRESNHFEKPMNIFEIHAGSWKQHDVPRESEMDVPPEAFYSYKELAAELIPYVKEMGYTHIELLPVMEHPFDGSWGYQVTGYFAPTSRYGRPTDFMYFVDECHKNGIGVILDWVPGHFCMDEHGLGRFLGNDPNRKLYEAKFHPQWGTYTFDFARDEVRSFLLSNAVYWMEMYHADGIRVDGVSSMLYLNFGVEDAALKRKNKYGGDEDLDAISFLREFNSIVGTLFPGTFTAAEESSSWPMVTKPPKEGGLGFHYKWDMGWMNDTLKYCKTDFPFRPWSHNLLTFSMMYAFSENFILPLSHDEVVHGKASLIQRQPGDQWRQFAGLRLLALYQMTHPGGKLNFMGNEIGQYIEWRYYEGIEYKLLKYPAHDGHKAFNKELNNLYVNEPALWEVGFSWDGFNWIDADNNEQGILIYERIGKDKENSLLVAINFNTDDHFGYKINVAGPGSYEEIFNTDESRFGGTGGHLNKGLIKIECRETGIIKEEKEPSAAADKNEKTKKEEIKETIKEYYINVTIPPLGGIILRKKKG